MSYDINLKIKPEGVNTFITIAYPEYSSPTYNLGDMFRACMDWNFNLEEIYSCDIAIKKIEHGIYELTNNREAYIRYNPPNGWGDIDSALTALISLRN